MRKRRLSATYRLQFHKGFTFKDATELVPYLAELGISHVYSSPYFKARPGSEHGYDVVDHNAFNPDVGSEADFDALVYTLASHNMGLIADFVPNHMGIAEAGNEWWRDVLEWGRGSPYAEYFDIDWAPAKPDLKGKVLVPFLGDHYGRVLYRGELTLVFDAEAGRFEVRYYDHTFPITPPQYPFILAPTLAALQEAGASDKEIGLLDTLIGGFRKIRPHYRGRELAATLERDLAGAVAKHPSIARAIEAELRDLNGEVGIDDTFAELHRLLERQHYRLAYWRVAADEVNYRRFFQINELAGIRTENPKVFEVTHRLLLRLIGEGSIQGLRIDHVDGLFDPIGYLKRLQEHACEVAPGGGPFPVMVEKILAPHESLRRDWPVTGTTGYDFMALVGGLFVDPGGEAPLDILYRAVTGDRRSFDTVVRRAKKLIMDNELASELQVLANRLGRIARMSPLTRDYTLRELRLALREVAAWFPVYRTYVAEGTASQEDRRDIDWAVAAARKNSPLPDLSIFDFVHKALTGDLAKDKHAGYGKQAVTTFANRFQQYTGPVMAKGLEDTAGYRYNRLVSLNEVGSEPGRFGTSRAAFHHLNHERLRHWPQSMLATATHDSKRGEDARARIHVLSEIADEWAGVVETWMELNAPHRREIEGNPATAIGPTPHDEYLIYQTLVGAWPAELLFRADSEPLAPRRVASFRKRMEAFAVKAAREAKVATSWLNPDPSYERALGEFVRHLLDTRRPNRFLRAFRPFMRRVAWFGMLNSLSQLTLKLTVPGVPDIYQGTELWDLSMVDPDNRRPIDFRRRRDVLAEVAGRDADRLLTRWIDGRIKMRILQGLLALRRDHPDLFLDGDYRPLEATGDQATHLCGFARVHNGRKMLVAVPRLCAGLTESEVRPPLARAVWGNTALTLTDGLVGQTWTHVLTREEVSFDDQAGAASLFAEIPVAVLVSTDP